MISSMLLSRALGNQLTLSVPLQYRSRYRPLILFTMLLSTFNWVSRTHRHLSWVIYELPIWPLRAHNSMLARKSLPVPVPNSPSSSLYMPYYRVHTHLLSLIFRLVKPIELVKACFLQSHSLLSLLHESQRRKMVLTAWAHCQRHISRPIGFELSI